MTERSSPTIRAVRTEDLPAIVAMRDELNVHELSGCPHASIQKLTLEEFTALWGETLTSPEHCWRIVEQDGRPIGFGLLYALKPRVQPPGAYLHWAYLKEGYRQKGTGQALLQELVGWARARDMQRIELQFIDGNKSAQQFWTKMGFQPYARKCVYYL